MTKTIIAVAVSAALGVGAAWGQATQQPQQAQQAKPAKNWKDRAEYDLYAAAAKESQSDPKKALETLNQWKEKYPASDYKEERLGLFLLSYQKLGDRAKMVETAKETLAEYPKNFQALYAATLLTPAPDNTSPEALDFGEKAANGFLQSLDEVFAADKKPANVTEEAFKKEKTAYESLGHRTLGWIAMTRKNYEQAETQLTSDLRLNPLDAEASYWLGSVIIAQKKPERFSEALYFIGRAACYSGPGAVPEPNRKAIESYLGKTYAAYHGQDPQGLQELCNLAKMQAFPPADFKILSEAEVAEHKDQELMKTNPQLGFWLKLKSALEDAGGEQYFESGMKGALIPPEGQPALKGHVISQEPAKNPKTLVLGIANASTPEVTLKLDSPMVGRAEPGTALEFRGVATSFSKAPFMVTFDVEKKNVTGWPAPVAPAKKAPARKGVSRKK